MIGGFLIILQVAKQIVINRFGCSLFRKWLFTPDETANYSREFKKDGKSPEFQKAASLFLNG